MFVALLAAQMLLSTPLPAEMEGTLTPYAECVNERFVGAIGQSVGRPKVGRKIMDKAIASCSKERAHALQLSERALESAAGFQNIDKRRAFVRERVNSLDSMLRWSVTPEGDPDNWK